MHISFCFGINPRASLIHILLIFPMCFDCEFIQCQMTFKLRYGKIVGSLNDKCHPAFNKLAVKTHGGNQQNTNLPWELKTKSDSYLFVEFANDFVDEFCIPATSQFTSMQNLVKKRCQVPGTWYHAPGTRYLAPGTWVHAVDNTSRTFQPITFQTS